MALDSLKAQGYRVDLVNFASSDLIPAALVRGDLDIGNVNSNTTWSAISKGADLVTIASKTNMTFVIVTGEAIQTCSDLNSGAVAFTSTQNVGFVMFRTEIKRNCPTQNPQIVLIPESKNRVAALQKGEIAGAYLEIEDWLYLNRQAPGKFHILMDLAKDFPEVQLSSFAVTRQWADKNPQVIKDFIRALLMAHRSVIVNPSLLAQESANRLSIEPAQAREIADAYAASKIWDPNGGLTRETVQSTIDFYVNAGNLPSGMKPDQVVDLSYMNAVLNMIGRQ